MEGDESHRGEDEEEEASGYEGDDERHLVERGERAEIEEFYSAPRSVEPSSEIDENEFTLGRVEPSHEIDEIDFTPGRVEPSHEIDKAESSSEPSVEIDENGFTLARVDTQEISDRVQAWLIDCPDRVPDDELVLSDTDYSGLQWNALALLVVVLGITIPLVTLIWLLAILYEASGAKGYLLAKD